MALWWNCRLLDRETPSSVPRHCNLSFVLFLASHNASLSVSVAIIINYAISNWKVMSWMSSTRIKLFSQHLLCSSQCQTLLLAWALPPDIIRCGLFIMFTSTPVVTQAQSSPLPQQWLQVLPCSHVQQATFTQAGIKMSTKAPYP